MQGYYFEAEDTSLDLDWQATMDYVADMKRYPVQPMTLKDCGNPLCTNQSYAVYCSTYCFEVVEGTEEPDDGDFYTDGHGVALGKKSLADTQWQADQAAGGFAAMACGMPQPEPVPAPAAMLPEAAVSMNVHIPVHGRDVLVTLRGVDEAEVMTRIEALLQRFPVPAPTASQSPPVETGMDVCPLHQVRMKLNHGKDGSTWYSHRLGEGAFCKGTTKGARRG